jgi:uncharacterized protein (TIGR03435 family)
VVATNVALHTIIEFAYGLDVLFERVEGPDLLQKRFDIMARAAGDVPRVPLRQVGPLNVMMQNLLAERFKLEVRMEERPHEGYALVRAGPDDRLGPGLRPSTLQCPRASSGSPMTEAASAPETGARADCTFTVINNEMHANGYQMSALAQSLSLALKSPVVDRTGLTGWYEVRMTYDQASLMELWGLKPVVDDAGPKPPSLFVALEEQLGLKLERERVTARTLVVEHVEPPSEN